MKKISLFLLLFAAVGLQAMESTFPAYEITGFGDLRKPTEEETKLNFWVNTHGHMVPENSALKNEPGYSKQNISGDSIMLPIVTNPPHPQLTAIPYYVTNALLPNEPFDGVFDCFEGDAQKFLKIIIDNKKKSILTCKNSLVQEIEKKYPWTKEKLEQRQQQITEEKQQIREELKQITEKEQQLTEELKQIEAEILGQENNYPIDKGEQGYMPSDPDTAQEKIAQQEEKDNYPMNKCEQRGMASDTAQEKLEAAYKRTSRFAFFNNRFVQFGGLLAFIGLGLAIKYNYMISYFFSGLWNGFPPKISS